MDAAEGRSTLLNSQQGWSSVESPEPGAPVTRVSLATPAAHPPVPHTPAHALQGATQALADATPSSSSPDQPKRARLGGQRRVLARNPAFTHNRGHDLRQAPPTEIAARSAVASITPPPGAARRDSKHHDQGLELEVIEPADAVTVHVRTPPPAQAPHDEQLIPRSTVQKLAQSMSARYEELQSQYFGLGEDNLVLRNKLNQHPRKAACWGLLALVAGGVGTVAALLNSGPLQEQRDHYHLPEFPLWWGAMASTLVCGYALANAVDHAKDHRN